MTQCPKCHLMFETAQKFCSICGSPTTLLEQDGAEELTAELRQPEKTPNPHKTRQFDAPDLSAPATANPSEQPASAGDGTGTSDAMPQPEAAAGSPPERGGASRWMRAALMIACVLALVGAVALGYILGQRSEAATRDEKDSTIQKLAAENELLSEKLSARNELLTEQLVASSKQCTDSNKQYAASNKQLTARVVELSSREKRLTADNAQLAADKKGLTAKVDDLESDKAQIAANYEKVKKENDSLRRSNAGNRTKPTPPAPGGRDRSRARKVRAE